MKNKDGIKLRSGEVLMDFIDYCLEHPQERFWQALRNFANVPFILISDGNIKGDNIIGGELKDTFYFEGKNE